MSVSAQPNIVYVGQYYAPTDTTRAQEIQVCLTNICKNVRLAEKHFLNERVFDCVTELKKTCPFGVHQCNFGKRLTFSDVLQYANKTFAAGTVVLFGNMDVYFDETVSKLLLLPPNTACAITRHDVIGTHAASPNLANSGVPSTSQDAWAITVPCRVPDDRCDFFFGRPGCDNRFAYELAAAGYYVWNAAHEIRVFHLHESQERDYHPQQDAIDRPYLPVAPHSLAEHIAVRSAWPERDPCEIAATIHKYLDVCEQVRLPIEVWVREEKGLDSRIMFDSTQPYVRNYVRAMHRRTFGLDPATLGDLDRCCTLVCSGEADPDSLLQTYFETLEQYNRKKQEMIAYYIDVFHRLPREEELQSEKTVEENKTNGSKKVSRQRRVIAQRTLVTQRTSLKKQQEQQKQQMQHQEVRRSDVEEREKSHERAVVSVVNAFKRELDREPDSEALTCYSKLLQAGILTASLLEEKLRNSEEGKAVHRQPHWDRISAIRYSS